MKIGILTIFRAVNNGAMLQAYATCSLLRKTFPDAEIEMIDCFPTMGIKKEIKLQLKGRKIKKIIQGGRAIWQAYRFIGNHLPLSPARLMTNNYDQAIEFIDQKYDLILVGSDVVFEIKSPSCAYAPLLPNYFYLPPEIKAVKVAFAASADGSDLDLATPDIKKVAKDSLDAFALLGVREQFTADFITALGADSAKIQLVPDPTFGLDLVVTNVRNKLRKVGVDFSRPRVAINLNRGSFSNALVASYKEKGYQVVGLMHHPHADVSLHGALTPFEWAEVPRCFNLTITDRFHGTLFALKNQARVLSLDIQAEYRDPKIISKKRSLLSACDLEYCYVGPDAIEKGHDYIVGQADIVEKKYSPEIITEKLELQKNKLFSYLGEIKKIMS